MILVSFGFLQLIEIFFNTTHMSYCSTLNLSLCYDLELMISKSELREILSWINLLQSTYFDEDVSSLQRFMANFLTVSTLKLSSKDM